MKTNSSFAVNETGDRPAKSSVRVAATIARIVMGLIFLMFGLNGFFNFIPPPKTPMPEGAMAFIGALMKSGYMIQLVSGTQAIVGVLLLLNRYVPLALALIAPVIVNIAAFHLFLAPAGWPLAFVVVALETYLAWVYRHTYRAMLAARAMPA